jgi:hypothetical protein
MEDKRAGDEASLDRVGFASGRASGASAVTLPELPYTSAHADGLNRRVESQSGVGRWGGLPSPISGSQKNSATDEWFSVQIWGQGGGRGLTSTLEDLVQLGLVQQLRVLGLHRLLRCEEGGGEMYVSGAGGGWTEPMKHPSLRIFQAKKKMRSHQELRVTQEKGLFSESSTRVSWVPRPWGRTSLMPTSSPVWMCVPVTWLWKGIGVSRVPCDRSEQRAPPLPPFFLLSLGSR